MDAVAVWIHHAGAPVVLSLADSDAGPVRQVLPEPDVLAGQHPQGIVPPDAWPAARSTGDWTLVSCTVSRGFSLTDARWHRRGGHRTGEGRKTRSFARRKPWAIVWVTRMRWWRVPRSDNRGRWKTPKTKIPRAGSYSR